MPLIEDEVLVAAVCFGNTASAECRGRWRMTAAYKRLQANSTTSTPKHPIISTRALEVQLQFHH